MNLDHLRYFEAVARLEHYGRAAEYLHVSQPNLNYAINQLETELGVPLFEHCGRNVRLTRYGRLFLQSVKGSLEQLDAGARTLREFGGGGGIVLLGGIRKLASQLVPELMRGFLEREENRSVRFEIHTERSFSLELLKAAEEGRVDMAFVSFAGDTQKFEYVSFRRSPFVLAVPPGHPLAGRSGVSLRETLLYPYIYFSDKAGLRPHIDEMFGKIGAVPNIAYETEEDDVVAGMVAAGFGIAVIPDNPVLKCQNIVTVPITDPNPSRTAYLCRRRAAEYPAAADRFFNFCREELRQRGM